MIPLQLLRENRKEIIESLKKRGFDYSPTIDKILQLDIKRREIQTLMDSSLSETNKLSKLIGEQIKSGDLSKVANLKEKIFELKNKNKNYQNDLNKIKKSLFEERCNIPNPPTNSVIKGGSSDENEIIKEVFKHKNTKHKLLSHWDLGKKYDIIDFELGVKITAAGFPVYKGKGAKLQRALINFFLNMNTNEGYQEVQVPHLVNYKSAFSTGQLPDKEGQMYFLEKENLYLIPTAEVPITNIYRGVTLDESSLPIALTGYTPCFRREAGSYGKDVRGLNRLHQFDKVEIVRLEKEDRSLEALSEMVEYVEKIVTELNLPYRILRLCGSDLGFTSACTYDFELFSSAQNKWLEISSVSTFENFQSERLKIKYKSKKGIKKNVHTLNGSALAIPRVIASILENNQTNDGIEIPKCLIPYTGFEIIN
ncbi:MAG: serine--tRNA ligase [Flavobacteriaceae bacterium]